MDLGLSGARVLVTAASQGLGAATARQFSREGCRVVINSRNSNKLEETAQSIKDETRGDIYAISADVTQPSAVELLIQETVNLLGGLDILVTNAGGPPSGNFDTFNLQTWEEATRLTLLSAVNLIQTALPHLRRSSRPAILAIVSIAAKEPVANLTLSNSLRPAVVGLIKTLSQELGPEGIRANSILPGITDTERITYLMKARAQTNNTSLDEEALKIASDIPLKRIGRPEEFANAAVFLCSPAAGFITGVALAVDGGAIHATL